MSSVVSALSSYRATPEGFLGQLDVNASNNSGARLGAVASLGATATQTVATLDYVNFDNIWTSDGSFDISAGAARLIGAPGIFKVSFQTVRVLGSAAVINGVEIWQRRGGVDTALLGGQATPTAGVTSVCCFGARNIRLLTGDTIDVKIAASLATIDLQGAANLTPTTLLIERIG